MRLAVVILAATAVAIATTASAADHVDIPGNDTMLRGVLYRPEGLGPFPAAVALHDCRGLVDNAGTPFRRMADWGERLAATGLAVLFPDSFSSRGLSTQC